MSKLVRIGTALVLAFYCTGLHHAYSQTKTGKKFPTGSISGRVTLKSKGKSGIVVGARIGESRNQTAPALKATTDPDGNYQITGLVAGTYEVTPLAPAFVVAEISAHGIRGERVILAEGENVERIDFSLTRGGVITGKVTFADGRAVIDEQVNIVEQEDQRSAATYPTMPQVTDDRGIYRIYGLPAGRYKVSVGQPDEGNFRGYNRGKTTYQRVFYPSVTNIDEAKVIELAEGGEATNVDISVSESIKGYAVSGQIVDGETGKPLSSMRLGIRKMGADHRYPTFFGAAANAQGEFRLENITPGKYSTVMMPQPNSDLNADPVVFEVMDQDLTGIIVRTRKGSVLSGTLVLEGTSDKAVLAKLSQLRLDVYVSAEGDSSGSSQSSLIGGDGGFRLGGLTGGKATLYLRSQDRMPPKGFMIARIERDGVVQPQRTIEIKPGEQIAGIRVVVLYGSGIVRGIVNYVNGHPPPVMRTTVRLTSSGGNSETRPVEADARGHFLIEGIPSGLYEVLAVTFIPGSGVVSSDKQPVNVTENGVTDVLLSIDLNPRQPKP